MTRRSRRMSVFLLLAVGLTVASSHPASARDDRGYPPKDDRKDPQAAIKAWCTANFSSMGQRQACIDSAGCHRGPYFDCGPAGTNIGLCSGVCCAAQQTCLENACSTTSTTHHTTYTRVELPAVTSYATNVIAKLVGGAGVITTFDQIYAAPPTSVEVQQAYLAAEHSLTSSSADFVDDPELVASTQSSTFTFVGEQIDHTEDTVTKTTATCGPQAVQTGDDLSEMYLVAPGTQNVNVNTHTETFVNQIYQLGVVENAAYQILGQDACH